MYTVSVKSKTFKPRGHFISSSNDTHVQDGKSEKNVLKGVSEICARDKNLITGIPLHSDRLYFPSGFKMPQMNLYQ
jgi:hypothetical protein